MGHSSKILLITEGEGVEVKFFKKYISVTKKLGTEIVPFSENVLTLYKHIKSYAFNGIEANTRDILRAYPHLSDENKAKLDPQNKYTDIFLIFDLDIQNAKEPKNIKQYLELVRELLNYFNNSTEHGLLLLNYPMMESYKHCESFIDKNYLTRTYPATIEDSHNYKNYLDTKKYNTDINSYSQYNFFRLAALNLLKANYIISGQIEPPTSEHYEYEMSQLQIFEKQLEAIKTGYMYVLNSASLISVELYGKSFFEKDLFFPESLLS